MFHNASRRAFLKLSAAVAAASSAKLAHAAHASGHIAINTDNSALVRTEPVQYALGVLREAITAAHLTDDRSAAALHIDIAVPESLLAKPFTLASAVTHAETVALIPGTHMGTPAILVTGVDARGIVYGLLELADRVRSSPSPLSALHLAGPLIETTPNKVRSVSRGFCSEVEDKPWYYDLEGWKRYFDLLAGLSRQIEPLQNVRAARAAQRRTRARRRRTARRPDATRFGAGRSTALTCARQDEGWDGVDLGAPRRTRTRRRV